MIPKQEIFDLINKAYQVTDTEIKIVQTMRPIVENLYTKKRDIGSFQVAYNDLKIRIILERVDD